MLNEELLNCWIETEISVDNRQSDRVRDKLEKLGFEIKLYNKKLYFSKNFMRKGIGTGLNGALKMLEKVKELDLKKFELYIDCYEPSGYAKFFYTSNKLKEVILSSNPHPDFEKFIKKIKTEVWMLTSDIAEILIELANKYKNDPNNLMTKVEIKEKLKEVSKILEEIEWNLYKMWNRKTYWRVWEKQRLYKSHL